MSSVDKLINILNNMNFSNKDSLIKRLRIITPNIVNKELYTESFINELNYLLSKDEKFSNDELQFLLNFSSLGKESKKFILSDLQDFERKTFDCIQDKILRSIEFYKKQESYDINISDLIKKLKNKKEAFITDNEIDFIYKIIKENFDDDALIDVLKEINSINMSIFNKYELSFEDLDGISENDLEITNINIEDIKNLLLNYGINFDLFSEELKEKLIKYGNLDKMDSILDFLKKEGILDEKHILLPEIIIKTLLYSNVEELINVKNKNDVDFKELVEKIPTVLYPTIKERQYNKGTRFNPSDSSVRSGNMINYTKNSDLLAELGISFDKVWKKCYSFFVQSHNANRSNIYALKSYGINLINDDNELKNIFSVLGNRNPSIIDIYDLALEADAKEYALKAPSSLSPSQMYKFYLIKLARKQGLNENEIFGTYTTPDKEIFLKTKSLINYLGLSKDDKNIDQIYESISINIPNRNIYDNIFEISNLNNISNAVLNDNNIKALERYSESDELYNFNGTKISKRKVLRRYTALKNNGKDISMSAIMYCLVYGSMLDEKEFNNIYELVKTCVSFEVDNDIYVIKGYIDDENKTKSSNLKIINSHGGF